MKHLLALAWLFLVCLTYDAVAVSLQKKVNHCGKLRRKLSKYSQPSLNIWAARPSEVRPCTRSVPFKASRDRRNLDSIVKYFQSFYGSLQIAKQLPIAEMVPNTYDIVDKLKAIQKKKWRRAQDFYEAVRNAIDGLNDGHTKLVLSCPPFRHRLLHPIFGLVEDGIPVVRTVPYNWVSKRFIDLGRRAPFNFRARRYANARVLQIEGKPAWSYMTAWAASKAHAYHTLGQNLNDAFAQYRRVPGARPIIYPGVFNYLQNKDPEKNFIRVTLIRDGQTKKEVVKIPFVSYINKTSLDNFNSWQSYYNAYCAPSSNNVTSPEIFSPMLIRGRTMPSPPDYDDSTGFTPLGLQSTKGRKISLANDLWEVYKMNDNTTVVALTTFDPALPSHPTGTTEQNTNFYKFVYFQTRKALQMANRFGSRILIDLSSNPGGLTVLVYLILELLVGTDELNKLRPNVVNPYNVRADTGVIKQLRAESVGLLNFKSYSDLNEVQFNESTASEFFYPVVKDLKFGPEGVKGDYSSLFKGQILSIGDLYPNFTVQPAFGTKPWAIFSNSLCFSSCSTFLLTLNLRFGIPVVAIGGIPEQPLAASAGGGGFAVDDVQSSFLKTFGPTVASLPGAPKAFTVGLTLGVHFANGFLATTTDARADLSAPIEFIYKPATYRLNYTKENYRFFFQQYLDAAKAVFG